MFQLFRDHRPQIVFHAAALKHLPVLERHPCEGVKSNVRGTENLVEAAIAHDVERFVLISTDKAANPTSVLGATKRLAELVLDAQQPSPTVLTAVRFGNVLGSRGSLLHVVRDQLASGSAVTVTHPDVSRFFMTIEEAVGLVLEAVRMSDGSATYVLDMGEPVRIVDLVRNFAEPAERPRRRPSSTPGCGPARSSPRNCSAPARKRLPTDHPRISMTRPPQAVAGFRAGLRELYDAAAHNRRRRGVPAPAPARARSTARHPGSSSRRVAVPGRLLTDHLPTTTASTA